VDKRAFGGESEKKMLTVRLPTQQTQGQKAKFRLKIRAVKPG